MTLKMADEVTTNDCSHKSRADAETVSIPFIFLTAKGEKPDIRAGMNLGADDYLTKPVAKTDLLAAIHSRLERAVQQAVPEFKP
jgi:DNA-binding response OmpR family regulator